MIKTFCTDDHPDLINEAGGRLFQFFDRSDRITKMASAAIGRADIQNHMPPHSHFGVHLISMATEEDFGPNKNGDSSSREALDKYHGTFEKYGSVFREHRNRCAKRQGIGEVKLARFNKEQGRGELLIWVDKEKAPDMWKAAKDDKELSWSMSMRLPFDRCSCCDKKSKTVADYCKDLKHSMLKYVPEHRKIAYARNEDDIKLFDISEVKNRAERIATYLKYFHGDEFAKAASADMIVTGAEWGSYHHGDILQAEFTPWERLTLSKLAAAASYIKAASFDELHGLLAAAPVSPVEDWASVRRADFRDVAGALAKRAMILPFIDFASIVTGESRDALSNNKDFKTAEACEMPELIDNLVTGACGCDEGVAPMISPDDCGGSFSSEKDAIDNMVERVSGDLGMTPEKVRTRVITITIKSAACVRKPSTGPVDPFYKALAGAYGHYLVKAAHIARDADGVSEHVLMRGIAALLSISQQNAGHAQLGIA